MSGAACLLVVLGLLGASGRAWSLPPGNVQSYQKISDLVGGFTAVIDNLDEFGGAVVGLGDLDGAGPSVAAVAVGAIGDDDGGSNRGAVYILFLDSTGNTLSYQKISSTTGGLVGPIDSADDFGSSVAFLGDLDGAGPSVAALAVGATGDDDGGLSRGAVYVLFLNSAGSVLSQQKISDTAGNFTAVIDNADEFGGALAGLGDLDGAGPSVGALAAGAIGDDDGGADRGCVYILFLASTGNVLSFQKISDTAGNFTAVIDNADEFGTSVASLGDLDGSGPSVGALAAGASFDDDGGPDRGCAYVLFLASTGNVLSYAKISDTAGNFTATIDDGDEFGGSLAGLGDLDGFGPSVGSLAAGAVGDDDGGLDRGAVYVLLLDATGNVVSYSNRLGETHSFQKISDTQGGFTAVIDDGDDFGATVAAIGDIDGAGSGKQNLVAGAPGDDDGGGGRGAIYVMSLKVSTLSASEPPPGAHTIVLGPAWPNPFNPTTIIPFEIGTTALVRIDICDVRGRLVRKLVQERASAGKHQAVWNGRDDAGRPLPSGTYLYKMSVDGQAAATAGKAVLLK